MTKAKVPSRSPDCITKVQVGNTILTVSGFYKQDSAETAIEKMMKVLKAETVLSSDPDGTKGGG